MTVKMDLEHLLKEPQIAARIFANLSQADLLNCLLVNKAWNALTRDAQSRRTLTVNMELLRNLNKSPPQHSLNFHQLVSNSPFKWAPIYEIYGWTKDEFLPNSIYDDLFTNANNARILYFKGRGRWDSCRCPKKASTKGEQFDTIRGEDITNLEYIHVSSKTFTISACALLDLVSRSPKLKNIFFMGTLTNTDHTDAFASKRFITDLTRLSWPWPTKRDAPTISILLKRNENLTTFYSTFQTTSQMLASELLPSLRFLSLNLSESWACKPGRTKKVFNHLTNIKYLALAKTVEALEVRTFDNSNDCEDEQTRDQVERVYEDYQLTFWEYIGKLPNLRYLAIYGSWELERSCREMAKHGLQIEFLKMNLMPSSVIAAIEEQDDNPIFSMVNGAKDLRKLSKLRSIHYMCFEKLKSIDARSVPALKEIVNLFWKCEMKMNFTDEVEDLLQHLVKRGHQLGKAYSTLR